MNPFALNITKVFSRSGEDKWKEKARKRVGLLEWTRI
jgi:hypothetical protein